MNAHTTVPNRPTTPAASPPAARSGASYQLSLPRDGRLPLARGWLWL
ncbi:MAG: hypothetical protein JSS19_07030, partial [Proteobacteria bacterium]|nr:hypothetical protein [Pseudomonadota bacterium]